MITFSKDVPKEMAEKALKQMQEGRISSLLKCVEILMTHPELARATEADIHEQGVIDAYVANGGKVSDITGK